MNTNAKGCDRWHGATLKTAAAQHVAAIQSGIKTLIVRLALWGLIPANVATWLIQRGGLKDV